MNFKDNSTDDVSLTWHWE